MSRWNRAPLLTFSALVSLTLTAAVLLTLNRTENKPAAYASAPAVV